MTTLRVLLGDQLTESISSLTDCDRSTDLIALFEVRSQACDVKHHKKKLIFLFSAMRHFCQQLREQGYRVHYTRMEDPDNRGCFLEELRRLCAQQTITQIIVTQCGEYRLAQAMAQWSEALHIPVIQRADNRFYTSIDAFRQWADGRKTLRLEHFYRQARSNHQILMHNGQPEGGQWNYDHDNRQTMDHSIEIPPPYSQEPDAITEQVITMVETHFPDHFGHAQPFHYAVTRAQAQQALIQFIEQRLPLFGRFQDAMVEGNAHLFHAHIALYLNCGLLTARECVEAAEQAYRQQRAPLNSVEGFIRQILGWREYVRGIYWLRMPQYFENNFFKANEPLPALYWTGNTALNCLKQAVQDTQQHAYAHHIQRLMVLGNFALLIGVTPKLLADWFLAVYADAYEWVELPNVYGMALFADGGMLASKPYAAGGNYINKMSNYCKNCRYAVKEKTGAHACPFNYLYWNFLLKHQDQLANNPRMALMIRRAQQMSPEAQQQIKHDAQQFIKGLHDEKK